MITGPIPTADELDECARRAQAGDTGAAEAVARGVWYFAWKAAGRIALRYGRDRDEVFSDGMAVLPRTIRRWRPGRAGFMTYFGTAATRAMTDRRKRQVRVVAEAGAEIPHTGSGFPAADLAEVQEAMAAMPDEFRAILDLRFGLTGRRLDNDAAAKAMGVTRGAAEWLLAEALDVLRARFAVPFSTAA